MLIFLGLEKVVDVNHLRLSMLIFSLLVPHPKNPICLVDQNDIFALCSSWFFFIFEKNRNVVHVYKKQTAVHFLDKKTLAPINFCRLSRHCFVAKKSEKYIFCFQNKWQVKLSRITRNIAKTHLKKLLGFYLYTLTFIITCQLHVQT
jgi:hypothetical protein